MHLVSLHLDQGKGFTEVSRELGRTPSQCYGGYHSGPAAAYYHNSVKQNNKLKKSATVHHDVSNSKNSETNDDNIIKIDSGKVFAILWIMLSCIHLNSFTQCHVFGFLKS